MAKIFFKNARWFSTSASFASCKRLLIQTLQILTFSPNSLYIVIENITKKPFNPYITYHIAKSNELEFTGAGVPTLSVQGIIKHAIGPVNAGAGAPPLCLQTYFIEGEGENPYNNSAEDRHLLTLIKQSINNINPVVLYCTFMHSYVNRTCMHVCV